MTKDEAVAILDRARTTWPRERQEDLARVALELEARDDNHYVLTDAQLADVRRIREDVRAGLVASDNEVAELWKKCGL
jgi:phage shock protein A